MGTCLCHGEFLLAEKCSVHDNEAGMTEERAVSSCSIQESLWKERRKEKTINQFSCAIFHDHQARLFVLRDPKKVEKEKLHEKTYDIDSSRPFEYGRSGSRDALFQ